MPYIIIYKIRQSENSPQKKEQVKDSDSLPNFVKNYCPCESKTEHYSSILSEEKVIKETEKV